MEGARLPGGTCVRCGWIGLGCEVSRGRAESWSKQEVTEGRPGRKQTGRLLLPTGLSGCDMVSELGARKGLM